MRATEIQPGVVYAYRQSRRETPRPIVFLAPVDRHHLYSKSRTHGRAFLRAPDASKPRSGTVYNGGTIGYPAALGDARSDPDDLRSVTLARFERVTSTLGRRVEYTLVTALACVVGPWEEVVPQLDAAPRRETA